MKGAATSETPGRQWELTSRSVGLATAHKDLHTFVKYCGLTPHQCQFAPHTPAYCCIISVASATSAYARPVCITSAHTREDHHPGMPDMCTTSVIPVHKNCINSVNGTTPATAHHRSSTGAPTREQHHPGMHATHTDHTQLEHMTHNVHTHGDKASDCTTIPTCPHGNDRNITCIPQAPSTHTDNDITTLTRTVMDTALGIMHHLYRQCSSILKDYTKPLQMLGVTCMDPTYPLQPVRWMTHRGRYTHWGTNTWVGLSLYIMYHTSTQTAHCLALILNITLTCMTAYMLAPAVPCIILAQLLWKAHGTVHMAWAAPICLDTLIVAGHIIMPVVIATVNNPRRKHKTHTRTAARPAWHLDGDNPMYHTLAAELGGIHHIKLSIMRLRRNNNSDYQAEIWLCMQHATGDHGKYTRKDARNMLTDTHEHYKNKLQTLPPW